MHLLIILDVLIEFVSIIGAAIAEVYQPRKEGNGVDAPTTRFTEWVMVEIY